MKIALILNQEAGTLRGTDVRAAADGIANIFRDAGHQLDVEICLGEHAIAAITQTFEERKYDAVVVGGGDGTISAAASVAAKGDIALGILPLGTMNLFARALKIPLDMREAAAALASGHVTAVDISEANGHLFTHHVTLGLHPHMVRIRQRFSYGSRYGKIWASVQAMSQALRDPPVMQVEIVTGEGDSLRMKTPIVVVTNNPLGAGHLLPYTDDPNAGMLGIYVGRSRRWTDLLELTAEAVMGDISSNPQLERRTAREAEIRLRRSRTRASIDGELVTLAAPINVRIIRQGLKVLKPSETGPAVVEREMSEEAGQGVAS